MDQVLLLLTVLAPFVCFTNGQLSCSPPNGGDGTCMPIEKCPLVLEIIRSSKTQDDFEQVKKYQCGFEGATPKVCCPETCKTPDNQDGQCVSISSCPLLATLLQPPLLMHATQYVQDSKCHSSQEYSVCCPIKTPTAMFNCSSTITDLPPDPRTGCCGVDTVVRNDGTTRKVGAKTTVNQYPWMVIIEYVKENSTKLLCLGSLISRRYVLTTGHCATGRILDIGKPVAIRLGEYDTSNNGPDCAADKAGVMQCTDGMIRIGIEKLIPHSAYRSVGSGINDIALIKLEQDAPFTEFIRPICLPSKDLVSNPPDDWVFYAAGWGKQSEKERSSNVKLQVDLPYVAKEQCIPIYSVNGRKANITSEQICAGGVRGKDTCRGDTGGPLMYYNGNHYEAVGITSFGPIICGLEGIPGVYTYVFKYLSWIISTINTDLTLGNNK